MLPINIKSDIDIKAPPSKIFIYLNNTKYLSLWNPLLNILSGDKILAEGDSYQSERTVFNKYTVKSNNVITKLVNDQLLITENELGLVKYKSTMKLVGFEGGTKVESKIEILTKPMLFGLSTSVLRNIAKHEINVDLLALKTVVENNIK